MRFPLLWRSISNECAFENAKSEPEGLHILIPYYNNKRKTDTWCLSTMFYEYE